ncbi:MAG: AlkZ family DNA glycosylase [Anaerolineae bacterium]|nr:AlkZ family DNA glycosylase [Anaerolineae bacterium]
MGAMQAQDYAMAKWAIGLRLPDSTDRDVEGAIDSGEIIRTHLLRPTWHFVAADDLRWILALTAPQIAASVRTRHRQLGLSVGVLDASTAVIERALQRKPALTRDEVISALSGAGIATDSNRASHLLLNAELRGVVCSGPTRNGKPTYALLEARVPEGTSLPREEALVRLARKYYSSHGPATLQDFVWWSGLSVGDARRGLEGAKSDLVSEEIDAQIYWLAESPHTDQSDKRAVHLLPAYDEFLISYRDRSASLPPDHFKNAVSENGVFRPTIVAGGQVVGLWKRAAKGNRTFVETSLFAPQSDPMGNMISEATEKYGRYLESEIEANQHYH